MLARVTSGQSGIVEYLQNGMKSGRELSRDVLDHRVNIDGNINITDKLIKEMAQDGRKENYLHITLSFGERDLKEETIIDAYQDYKKSIMSAYSEDEFNVYAEIHYPKVKSYKDKKTGDLIERFPHVHMVIPEKNLVSDKALNPFGLYSSNIKYHDAIQETVNRKHGLESPYDNQRKYRMTDNSEFISRYKGDAFKGSNSEFKQEIFELIDTKKISSMEDFKKELSNYGEVSTGKAGAVDEYLQVKPTGKSKNIRLKESAFKTAYIEKRELLREKPSDKAISKDLNTWVDTRSHEMKHIHVASPKVRKEFNALNKAQQKGYLDERRDDFTRRYFGAGRTDSGRRNNNIRPSGRAANREPGITRSGGRRFTDITNGLPGMPERHVDGHKPTRKASATSVLPSNEYNNLESRRSSERDELRRSADRSRRSGRRVTIIDKSNSLSEQLLKDQQTKNDPQTLQQFREIRKRLDPERLLNHFEKNHGLIKKNYQTFKAKDGSARIKVGNRAFNVSDFSTQHMRQDWQSTKDILTTLYKKQLKSEHKNIDMSVRGLKNFNQLKSGLPKKNLWANKKKFTSEVKQEKQALNSIVFVSGYVTQDKFKHTSKSNINHSVQILKHLQRKERYGETTMDLSNQRKENVKDEENTISSNEIDLTSATEYYRKQKELVKSLTLKMGDLVAAKDFKNGKVEFSDKNTGDAVFKDTGTQIVMSDKKASLDHVAVAMTFAAEKFGKVKINGTEDFKDKVIAVAVAKDLNVVFADKKMQERFINDREEFKAGQNNQQNNQENKTDDQQNSITNINPSKQVAGQPKNEAPINQVTSEPLHAAPKNKAPVTLISHGTAPYKNEKENSDSYFVKTSDGKTEWGVGLKDAVEQSNAKIGDEISIKKTGSEDIKIKVDIKDEQGNVTGQEDKEVVRVTWEVNKLETDKLSDDKNVKKEKDIKQFDNDTDTKKEIKSFNVEYEWFEKDHKMQVTINGKSPKTVPDEVMKNIKNNDKFLKNYTMEDIKEGKLELGKTNNQPVPKTFNTQGIPQESEQKQAPKLTQ